MASEDKLLKLQQYQRTQDLIKAVNFEKAIQLPVAAGAEGSVVSTGTKQSSSFILRRAQDSAARNDMSVLREHLEVMRDMDPANPYYSSLLERINHGEHISWKEFENAVDRFSSQTYYQTKLQDEINNVRLAASTEETGEELGGERPPNITDFRPAEKPLDETPLNPQPSTEQPTSTSTPPSAKLPPRPPLVFKRQTNKERFGTKENYAKYKDENQEERKKRAKDLWDRRKAGLLRGKTATSGFNPLGDWLGKKVAEKIAQSRIGQAVARNFIDPVKQAITNSRAWQAVAPRLQPVANALDKIASPFRAVSNALGAPERWLNSQMGNLANWAGRGLQNLGAQAIRGIGNQIGNLFNAEFGSDAAPGADFKLCDSSHISSSSAASVSAGIITVPS